MTIDTQKLRDKAIRSGGLTPGESIACLNTIDEQAAEIDRLQRIIDSRPAINAGLPLTYIEWAQSIYAMEVARVRETPQ